MSGFSRDWLALREPADHRARDRGLMTALGKHFAGRDTLAVVDLGCGTGSNLRALASHLPARQQWRLVDHDPKLLAAARERLEAWADTVEGDGDDLRLSHGGQAIAVAFVTADLSADIESALGAAPDLVTAAALFDLVSADWIQRFAAAVTARRATFYTALTYDGRERWNPPHPDDAAVFEAFHGHQRRDKGFGPSAGPKASEVLARAFADKGYTVTTRDSPWRLGSADARLIAELADGIAAAVRETGEVPGASVAAWLTHRRCATACTIGHTDLLARALPA